MSQDGPLSDEEYLAFEAKAKAASEALALAEAALLAAEENRHLRLREFNDLMFELRAHQSRRLGAAS